MPLVYEYNAMPDIVTAVGLSDDTKNKLRTEADQRLTYPGSRPPGRTASTAAARLSRFTPSLCTRGTKGPQPASPQRLCVCMFASVCVGVRARACVCMSVCAAVCVRHEASARSVRSLWCACGGAPSPGADGGTEESGPEADVGRRRATQCTRRCGFQSRRRCGRALVRRKTVPIYGNKRTDDWI